MVVCHSLFGRDCNCIAVPRVAAAEMRLLCTAIGSVSVVCSNNKMIEYGGGSCPMCDAQGDEIKLIFVARSCVAECDTRIPFLMGIEWY